MAALVPPISIERLQGLWTGLAHRYFQGRLPPIAIEWSRRLTASAGLFVSRVGPRSRRVERCETRGSARMIRLSLPLLGGQDEDEIIRTLAHEMIHQWQFDVRKRRPAHGQDFREWMARMNRDGLAVTLRHSLILQVEAFTRYLWHCAQCGMTYPRQRRTIHPRRHCCGRCRGRLLERRVPAVADFSRIGEAQSESPKAFLGELWMRPEDSPRQLDLPLG